MNTTLRGLTTFVSDIRAASNKEAETKRINKEMANIRAKFKEGNMDGYSKKKYVSKLIYMYMLGYEIDFGHMEALHLLSASKFSEKFMGYLACSVLLNETHDFLKLTVNSINNDLMSRSETSQCLALGCVAAIANREMAEALFSPVVALLMDPASKTFVKKKAALCLLKFHRKGAGDLSAIENFADRCAMLLDDRDFGVANSVMSLILGIVSRSTKGYESLAPKIVRLLVKIVLDKAGYQETHYHKVASPWLTVKLLRALQYFDIPEDKSVKQSLFSVLTRIFSNIATPAPFPAKSTDAVAWSNASHAILFEAMNLIIHMYSYGGSLEGDLLAHCSKNLGRFIDPKESINTRYMGLETMNRLITGMRSADLVRQHQDIIMTHLKDNDISIRRRALDLVYTMCDKSNATAVTAELLLYLKDAEVAIRPELVLKIAILAEKFAPDYSWYVDQILRLISIAGDQVSDDIWHRVIHIITNNEALQKYSAETVFMELGKPKVHETLVKVGGYILGEFGTSITTTPGMGPAAQFALLHKHFATAKIATRSLLLTAYAKMANNFPELRRQIAPIFDANKNVIDAELQQRAVEYSSLIAQSQIAPAVLEPMPPFPPRENNLLKRLETGEALAADPTTRTLSSLTTASSGDSEPGAASSLPAIPVTSSSGGGGGSGSTAATSVPLVSRAIPPQTLIGDDSDDEPVHKPTRPPVPTKPNSGGGALDDILGGISESAAPASSQPPPVPATELDMLSAVLGSAGAAPVAPAVPAVNADMLVSRGAAAAPAGEVSAAQIKGWFDKLCLQSDGVLYEDANVQIGLKTEYTGTLGRLALFYGNKTAADIAGFTVTVPPANEFKLNVSGLSPTLPAKAQSQQMVQLECSAPFSAAPGLQIGFTGPDGLQKILHLKLPVTVFKFTRPVSIGAEFMNQWRELAGPPRETQSVFKSSIQPLDIAQVRARLTQLHLEVFDGIDPNPANIVCAGAFTAHPPSGEVSVNILGRLETNAAQGMIRLTVRTKSGALTVAAHAALAAQLSAPQ